MKTVKIDTQSSSTIPATSSPRKKYIYECGACDKSFKMSSELTRHYRIHTGEKPFECTVCQMKFMESGDLGKHMRRHTGEKRFCCEVCDKKFSCSGTLKKHSLIHTGEKPYGCEICEKTFRHNCSLQQHLRAHAGEKPFECKECQVKFTKSSHVLRHNRRFHKEKLTNTSATEVAEKITEDQTTSSEHESAETPLFMKQEIMDGIEDSPDSGTEEPQKEPMEPLLCAKEED